MATKLTIHNNGSVKVEGEFTIVDPNGTPYDLNGRDTVFLCRCGMSKTKPFCDGAHKGNFDHQAIAYQLPPKKV